MANPGFPQQPMQPPMSGAPQGAVPPPKPVKRGASKMVPIVVSAGLAVGTFCGLLFGVGLGEPASANSSSSSSTSSTETKKDEPKKDEAKPTQVAKAEPAKAEPAKTEPAKTEPAKTDPAAGSAAGSGSAAAKTTEPAKTETGAGSGSAAKTEPAKTEPAKAGTGTGSGSATPAKTEVKVAEAKKPKLTIEVSPTVPGAKVTVDGKAVDGSTYEVDLGKATKKEVKIVVKANGYKTAEQKVEVDSDLAVKIELVKRPVVPSSGGTKPPAGKDTGKKKPPGGLIDI